jgi:hypothetical protein
MSQIIEMKIIVSGMAGLLEAIAEAGLECARSKTFQTDEGKHAVDLVVTDEQGTKTGVRVDARTGEATFIAHGEKGSALAHRVMQRYAYSKVLGELKRKGYQVGKEEKQKDGSIRLVAQRWR